MIEGILFQRSRNRNMLYLILGIICCFGRLSADHCPHPFLEDFLTDLLECRIGVQEGPSDYLYNPWVPPALWEDLKPYFLPVNHPIKANLDRLFHRNRATLSLESFKNAGFQARFHSRVNLVIGQHAQFQGYLFKVYLDTQPDICEWSNWVRRIEGAHAIKACIKRHGYKHFSVPSKWIYPLPQDPSPPFSEKYHRKNYILIVEDMHLVNSTQNLKSFKKKMTPQLLKELYTILSEEGLIDSVYPDNIPFTKRGQIAFIDTEHHHLAPIPYDKLTPFLSADMQDYWQSITN